MKSPIDYVECKAFRQKPILRFAGAKVRLFFMCEADFREKNVKATFLTLFLPVRAVCKDGEDASGGLVSPALKQRWFADATS